MRKFFLIALLTVGLTLTASAQAPPCCFVADVTGDFQVDEDDFSAIRQHIFGTSTLTAEQRYYADVTGEGSIDERDLRWILRFIEGTIETFPKCGDLDRDGFLEYDALVPNDDDDLVILSNHITGIAPIANPTTRDNADADHDCVLTSFDSLLFRQLELGAVQHMDGCTYQPIPCVY